MFFCLYNLKFQEAIQKNQWARIFEWWRTIIVFLKDEDYVQAKLFQTHFMEAQAPGQQFCGHLHTGNSASFSPSLRNLTSTLKALRIPTSSKDVCSTLFNPVFSKLISSEPLLNPCGEEVLGEAAFRDGSTSLCPRSALRWLLLLTIRVHCSEQVVNTFMAVFSQDPNWTFKFLSWIVHNQNILPLSYKELNNTVMAPWEQRDNFFLKKSQRSWRSFSVSTQTAMYALGLGTGQLLFESFAVTPTTFLFSSLISLALILFCFWGKKC